MWSIFHDAEDEKLANVQGQTFDKEKISLCEEISGSSGSL